MCVGCDMLRVVCFVLFVVSCLLVVVDYVSCYVLGCFLSWLLFAVCCLMCVVDCWLLVLGVGCC